MTLMTAGELIEMIEDRLMILATKLQDGNFDNNFTTEIPLIRKTDVHN